MTHSTETPSITLSSNAGGTRSAINRIAIKMTLFGGAVPLIIGIALHVFFPNWVWQSIPAHAVVETLGTFAATSIALLIGSLLQQKRLAPEFLFVALSLITMGILEGFLAVHDDGADFIWLHSISTFLGGLLMAMVWLPRKLASQPQETTAMIGIAAIALLIATLSFLLPDMRAVMGEQDRLSVIAIVLNSVGGVGFLVAALYFVLKGRDDRIRQRIVFASFCFLFGAADIMFEFSNLWDAAWWLWHVLRLVAYAIVLHFFFTMFARGQAELSQLNQNLEARVAERTKDLNAEILERRALQEQYRKSEERTRMIVNSAVDGIITIDSRGTIRTFNHGAEKIFGYSVFDVVGQNVSMLMPRDVAGHHDEYIQNYIQSGEDKVIGTGREVVGRGKDGRPFLMELSVSEFHDGEETTFVGIVRDITERKETEYRLNRALSELKKSEEKTHLSEQRLRGILESSASGIIVAKRSNFHPLFANQRLLDMFGARDLDEFFAYGLNNTFANAEDFAKVIDIFKNLNGAVQLSFERIRLDGTHFWTMQDLSTITFEGEACIIVWVYDVTEQKQAEESLIEAERMASLGGLVAGVAHEVNTPLGVGVTAATHLKERAVMLDKRIDQGELRKSDLMEFIETAISSTNMIAANLSRASDLIRSFKQVAVDQSSEEHRTINLLGYVREVLASLHPQLKNTNHDIQVSGDEDISITTQPGAVSQVITNLVMNSLIHAYEEGQVGSIRIDVTQQGQNVILQYTDDGKGMSADVRANIFEPFFTTRRGSGGSGLGMHILFNQVTQTLSGTVTCDSTPGQGTAFTITIPRKAGEEQ